MKKCGSRVDAQINLCPSALTLRVTSMASLCLIKEQLVLRIQVDTMLLTLLNSFTVHQQLENPL